MIRFLKFLILAFSLQLSAAPLDRWNFAMVSEEEPSETSLDIYSQSYTVPGFGPWAISHELLAFDQPLRTIFDELQEREMMIVVDCSIFVQLAALALNRKLDDPKARILAMGSADPETLPKFFGRTFAYVAPVDPAAAEKLQSSHYLAKGHWLLKTGRNRYLGLSLNGAGGFKTQGARAWVRETRQALFDQMIADERGLQGCDSDLVGLSKAEVSRRIGFGGAKFLRDNGRLETWKLTEFAP